MIDRTVTPRGTWQDDPVVRTLTGMHAWVKPGEALRYSPVPSEGCTTTEETWARTAIAAGKAAVLSISSQNHWPQGSVNDRQYRLQMSASNRQHHHQVSASDEQCRPRMSVNVRQSRLQAADSSRHPLLHPLAAAARSSPLLRERASSPPGHLQLPLAVTGELMKPRRRAFVARPAAKAANEHSLPLPRQVEAVLPQAKVPPVTGNTGSKGGFA
jgi:hypothetical protein